MQPRRLQIYRRESRDRVPPVAHETFDRSTYLSWRQQSMRQAAPDRFYIGNIAWDEDPLEDLVPDA